MMKNSNISKRVCVFAHYDKDNIVDKYVLYYLSALQTITDNIVFVSVSNISDSDTLLLKKMGITVILRENVGYDFCSYKTGLEHININDYDEVILCNDSVYGPIFDLEPIFFKMKEDSSDFWGFTDSNQLSYHLQSYFLVFKEAVIHSERFKSFWERVEVLDDKLVIIEKYEVGLTTFLLKEFRSSAVFPVKNVMGIKHKFSRTAKHLYDSDNGILSSNFYMYFMRDLYTFLTNNFHPNSIIHFWNEAIAKDRVPFVKKSLFIQKIFTSKDKNNLLSMIKNHSDYSISLITNHQDKLKYKNES